MTTRETEWVAASTTQLEFGVATTTAAGWGEVNRFTVPENAGYRTEIIIEGKRTDAFGFAAGKYGSLIVRDGAVSFYVTPMYEYMPGGIGFRAVAGADYIAFEVEGVMAETWDWTLSGFSREIT